MRDSKLVSWGIFGIAAAFLCLVVWSRFFDPTPEGRWQPDAVGAPVGDIPLQGVDAAAIQVEHPAVLYFFRADCRFCPPAAERLNATVAARGPSALPIYAITNEWDSSTETATGFAPGVTFARLSRTTAELTFVRYLPLMVRTGADGRIEAAYAGIPPPGVLDQILRP